MSSAVLRRVWAVVPAAGRGTRFGTSTDDLPKQYATLRCASVLQWSIAPLLREPRIEGIVVALAADDRRWPDIAASMPASKVRTAVGGPSRQESVLNALQALKGCAADEDWVLVHDAARPCLASADLEALIDAVQVDGGEVNGALLAAPVVDTVKRERDGMTAGTVDRDGLWRALTPQAFQFGPLRQALVEAVRSSFAVTDEAQAMERRGVLARLVRGSPLNIKVTTPADLAMAEVILKGMEQNRMRIGQGFDVHAFGAGDHVILGGVRLDYTRGVVAHSDGDVVIHALCDALLGALAMGDIGQHFPDNDAAFRGADSRVFLREVAAKMHAAGLELVNADITVLAEAPRVARHREAMAQNLAADLGTTAQRLNIKATTTEKLGFIGRGEGLAASAAVLLDNKVSQ